MELKHELAPEIRLESRKILANHEGLGHVYECGCGAIHLVLGAVKPQLLAPIVHSGG